MNIIINLLIGTLIWLSLGCIWIINNQEYIESLDDNTSLKEAKPVMLALLPLTIVLFIAAKACKGYKYIKQLMEFQNKRADFKRDWNVIKRDSGEEHISKIDLENMQSIAIETNGSILLGFSCFTEGNKAMDVRINSDIGHLEFMYDPIPDLKTRRVDEYNGLSVVNGFMHFNQNSPNTDKLIELMKKATLMRITVSQVDEPIYTAKFKTAGFDLAYEKITKGI